MRGRQQQTTIYSDDDIDAIFARMERWRSFFKESDNKHSYSKQKARDLSALIENWDDDLKFIRMAIRRDASITMPISHRDNLALFLKEAMHFYEIKDEKKLPTVFSQFNRGVIFKLRHPNGDDLIQAAWDIYENEKDNEEAIKQTIHSFLELVQSEVISKIDKEIDRIKKINTRDDRLIHLTLVKNKISKLVADERKRSVFRYATVAPNLGRLQNEIKSIIDIDLINNTTMKGHRREWAAIFARGLYNGLYGATWVIGVPAVVYCVTGNFGFFDLQTIKTTCQEKSEDIYKTANQLKIKK